MNGIIGIKDSADFLLRRKRDGLDMLYVDYANETSLNFTSDAVYAMKKGVRAIRWDKGREGTLTFSADIYDLKWISILLGAQVTTGVTQISKREVKLVANGTVTLAEAPKAGSLALFALESDKITHKTELTVGTPATNNDEYSLAGAVATVHTSLNGQYVVAYYLVDTAETAQKFSIKYDEYPENYEIFATTAIRDTNGVDAYFDMHIPNCKPKSTFDFTLSADNVAQLKAEFDLFPDENNDLAVFTIV